MKVQLIKLKNISEVIKLKERRMEKVELGNCFVFLGKTLNSHSASLHPGV